MLTFLNSAILFGLAAVAIPVLIHLFTRQKTKVVYFSSLRFLKELQKQKIRRLKIRQILLLILRTLVIMFLVAAFARPTLKTVSSASLSAGAQLTAVVILDNSYSMGREKDNDRLIDEAKRAALEVLTTMRNGDEIHLLYPQDPPLLAHDGPLYRLESVNELIKNTELSYHTTDYKAALGLANTIMSESSNINKEVYLITDLQKNGLKVSKAVNGTALFTEDVKLFVLPIAPAEEQNLGVTDLAFGNQIIEKDKVIEVEAVIRNFDDRPIENKLAHLFVNGKRLAQSAVNIGTRSSQKVIFRIVPERTGFQSAVIRIEEDNLSIDNRRYLSFNIAEQISVLLVGNTPNDTHFLKLALQPTEELTSYLDIEEIAYGEFQTMDVLDTDVVILSNVPRLNATETVSLQNFLKEGGGIMLFLGTDVDLRNYSDGLHKKLKLPELAQHAATNNADQFLSLGKIDFSHPIFNGVFDENKAIESPHFRFAARINSKEPLDAIIEYSDGSPFLFDIQYGKGHLLYVTTSISSDWSDLIFRGIFVPLVNRSVTYLAGNTSLEVKEHLIGDGITFVSNELTASTEMIMKRPDETEFKIKPEVALGDILVKFDETDLPGIYQLIRNEEIVAQWAVNINAIESNNETVSVDDLQTELNIENVYLVDSLTNITEELNEKRFGRELWKVLVGIALALLILETLLFKENLFKRDTA